MRRLIMAAAAAAAFTMSLGAAEAMPIAPASGLEASPAITLVSGGCGPYGHRGPYGGCRPNFGPRRFYHPHPYGFYGRPYGYHPYHRFYGGPRPFFRY